MPASKAITKDHKIKCSKNEYHYHYGVPQKVNNGRY